MEHKRVFKKIAVFRALQLEEMLCAVPALRALRNTYPDAEITLIGLPWSREFALRFGAYIDHFIPFPGFKEVAEKKVDDSITNSFIERMREEKFDVVIQLHNDGTITNSLISEFDANYTAGSYRRGTVPPYSSMFWEYDDNYSEIDRCLAVMQKLTVSGISKFLEFPIFKTERYEAEQLPEYMILQNRKYVVIHPGAKDVNRRWSTGYFASVADRLSEFGYTVVITGDESEKKLADLLLDRMEYPAVNLVGRISIGATAWIVKQAELVITNSTSMSYLSDAFSIPSIIIFLASDPLRWAPIDKKLHSIVTKEHATPFTILKHAQSMLTDMKHAYMFQ